MPRVRNDSEYFETICAHFRGIFAARDAYLAAAVGGELSLSEIQILAVLDKKTTATKIAKDLGMSKALVSQCVKQLREKELIDISISEKDKRAQVICLTQDGLAYADKIWDAQRKIAKKAFKNFNSEEQIEVFSLLARIAESSLIEGKNEN